MKKVSFAFGLLMALTIANVTFAQQASPKRATETSIGKLSMEQLAQKNQEGAAAVAAVEVTANPLSGTDNALMMEVAMGGMMQLEVSRIAAQKTNNDAVRMLAEAEIDEQTGLSAKLKEVASAKGITLPSTPDAATQAMLTKMQSLNGAEFDRTYVQESGVKGHEKLDTVMSKVEANASDSALKGIATAAHPLVKTHLQVSQDLLGQLSGRGRMSGRR